VHQVAGTGLTGQPYEYGTDLAQIALLRWTLQRRPINTVEIENCRFDLLQRNFFGGTR